MYYNPSLILIFRQLKTHLNTCYHINDHGNDRPVLRHLSAVLSFSMTPACSRPPLRSGEEIRPLERPNPPSRGSNALLHRNTAHDHDLDADHDRTYALKASTVASVSDTRVSSTSALQATHYPHGISAIAKPSLLYP